MKKLALFFKIILISIFIISCKNSEQKPSEESITEEELVVEEETHHSDGELTLNNGMKWQANPETTEGVIAMMDNLEAFRNLGLGDYAQLRVQLEDEFRMIFEKCTMKGEAHNQLHNYLYPMRDYFSKLSKGSETAEKAFLALEDYVPVYFDYFE